MATSPTFFATPKTTPNSWTNSDSANTKKTVVTAGSNGSKVLALNASSTDTVNRIAQVWLTRSAVSYLLSSQTVTAASGSDGATSTANLLALIPSLPHDNDGQPYLFLESSDTLQVSFTTQVTSAKEIDVWAIFANE